MSRVHNALRRLEQTSALPISAAGLEPDHWLVNFVADLLHQFRAEGDLTFGDVRELLEEHERSFLSDLEIARRMYRTYPHLLRTAAVKAAC